MVEINETEDENDGWPKVTENQGRDPFNQNSDRSDREKRTTSKGGPVFSKLFRLDRTDPLSFGPKFPEILVEWIAPQTNHVVATGINRPARSRNIIYYVITVVENNKDVIKSRFTAI